jgi:Ni/Fe-hydrogenase 1 B-type cytochrome subunit
MAISDLREREQVYVWQLPVRLAHWIHVAAMVALTVSGYYIGQPYLVAPSDPTYGQVMGTMRLTHAVGATFLGLTLVMRLYWSLVGNRCSRFGSLVPIDKRRRRDFWRQLSYYLFLTNERSEYLGHNPVAGLTYFLLYVLVFVQGVIGLALYSEYYPGGFWWMFFGWAFRWIAQNNILRLVHHSLMWVFGAFLILHLYLAVLNDLIERSGIGSSILTGYKYPHGRTVPEDWKCRDPLERDL